MTTLNRRARALIAEVGESDGPTEIERARLRASVLSRVGATVAAGSAGAALTAEAKAKAAVVIAGTGGKEGLAGAPTIGTASTVAKGSLAALVTKALVAVVVVGVGATSYLVTSSSPRTAATAVVQAPARLAAPPGTPIASPAVVAPARALVAPAPVASIVASIGPALPLISPPARPSNAAVNAPLNAPVNASATAAMPQPSRAEAPSLPRSTNPAPETFGAETDALGTALAALRDRRPAEALAALDAQDSLYGQGVLGEERAASRIDALCALGRRAEARAAAARFLADHPHSLLAPRVAAACEGVSSP
jgi:hypothetical protein